MWQPRDDTRLRLGWGRYYQAHSINELQVPTVESQYQPTQRATHLVASVEHDLADAVTLRAEAYRKDYEQPIRALREPAQHAGGAAGAEAGPHPDRARCVAR